MSDPARPLAGKVALVAGATRGAGRGIAVSLGEAGALVYCSGRSAGGVAATPGRPETLEETVALVAETGGQARLARCDHTREADVKALAERIGAEAGGLDILVNDVWGGDALIDWGQRFWELDMAAFQSLVERAVFSHVLTARHAAPLMLDRPGALIVEVGDGELPGYRGQLAYDFVKSAVIRLAYAMAWDLAETPVTALALSPGFLRSEHVLEQKGVTEANWRDAVARDPTFEQSETPRFIGRAIAALAADPNLRDKSGRALFVADLADEYGFTDADGRTPRFWPAVDRWLEARAAAGAPPDARERRLGGARYAQVHNTAAFASLAGRLADRLGYANLPPALQPSGGG